MTVPPLPSLPSYTPPWTQTLSTPSTARYSCSSAQRWDGGLCAVFVVRLHLLFTSPEVRRGRAVCAVAHRPLSPEGGSGCAQGGKGRMWRPGDARRTVHDPCWVWSRRVGLGATSVSVADMTGQGPGWVRCCLVFIPLRAGPLTTY